MGRPNTCASNTRTPVTWYLQQDNISLPSYSGHSKGVLLWIDKLPKEFLSAALPPRSYVVNVFLAEGGGGYPWVWASLPLIGAKRTF